MRSDSNRRGRRRYISAQMLAVVFAGLTGAGLPGAALRQACAQTPGPRHPIILVVTQGAGSGSDIAARLVARYLGDELGQAVIVENKPGGGGVVGHEAVLRSRDGNTFVFSSTAPLFVVPYLNKAAAYRYKDFAPVAGVMRTPFVVLVPNTDTAPRTLQELIASLRAKEQPYSSAGYGTMTHLASAMLLDAAGVKAVHVPYKGSGASLNDLIGQQVAFASDSLTAAVPFIRSGQLRALAVSSAARQPKLPQVPTLQESGYEGLVITAIAGLFAPKDSAAGSADSVAAAMSRVMQNQELRRRFQALDTEPLDLPPGEFARLLQAEELRWGQLLRQLGVAAAN